MAWEKLRVAFPVEFDVNGIVWRKLDAARAAAGPKDYVDFYQSARFARTTGERRGEAMGWLDEGMRRGESFWMDELKGDLLADDGRYAEAIPHLEKAIEASKKAGAPEEWRDGARKKLAGWRAKGKD
jgi:tetratricopeptide (TPR) repeat protein